MTDGERAVVTMCQDEYDEARVVTQQLKDAHDELGHQWNEMAIFYRMNALSRVMEDALRRENIPYQIARGVEFYNRKRNQRRVGVSEGDCQSQRRDQPDADSQCSYARPRRSERETNADLRHRQRPAAVGRAGAGVEISGVSARAGNSAKAFVEMITSCRALANDTTASDDIFAARKGRVQTVMENIFRRSGMEAALKKFAHRRRQGRRRDRNVEQLITSAGRIRCGQCRRYAG